MRHSKYLVILVVLFSFSGSMLVSGQGGGVVYQIEGMDKVTVQNIEYHTVDDKVLTMDVYYPADLDASAQLPAVIFINGFPDSQAQQFAGSSLKDLEFYTSWARLIAASGLIGVTYQTEHVNDLGELVLYIQQNAEALQIDGDRLAVWANSGNPPVAISYIMQQNRAYIRAAVFYYGFMFGASEEARTLVNQMCERGNCYPANEGFRRFRSDLPLFVVRAGFDDAGINSTIDAFVAEAIAANVPITFINYEKGLHGFDERQNTARSSQIIAFTLEFLKTNLAAE